MIGCIVEYLRSNSSSYRRFPTRDDACDYISKMKGSDIVFYLDDGSFAGFIGTEGIDPERMKDVVYLIKEYIRKQNRVLYDL